MARSIPKRSFRYPYRIRMSKFTPDEITIIGGVYRALLSEAWFNRNAVTERELLKLLISSYRQTPASGEELLVRCAAEAERRFGRRR